MITLLPFFCFVAIFLLYSCTQFPRQLPFSWRNSFLLTSIILGLFIVVSTELLSIFQRITFLGILTFWLCLAFILLINLSTLVKKKRIALDVKFPRFTSFEITALFPIILTILAIAVTAFVSPPNNWDSLTYHMSRVVHWIQNHSVTNYPTNIIRQINYTPGAEFAILHLQILNHGDRMANFVQWFSMAGSLIGVSLIAKELGANRYLQIISSASAVTIPMGILQGSSTQNDYVATFWIVCFVYFFLLWRQHSSGFHLKIMGVSLGLGWLTKGTCYIYTLPFLLWFLLTGIKKDGLKITRYFLIVIAISSLINLGYFMRSVDLNRNITTSINSIGNITNEKITISSFLSNVLCNASLHLGTPFKNINALTENGFRYFYAMSKSHATISDTPCADDFPIALNPFHEDAAGNFLHFMLAAICLFSFLILKSHRKEKLTFYYLLAITFAFLLFNLFLKWTPWNSRFHLPIFVLLSPWICISLSKMLNQKCLSLIMIALFVFSIPWIIANESRPLLGKKSILTTPRAHQYFSNNPGFIYSYLAAAKEITLNKCTQVGLWMGEDSWEYPLWAILKGNNREDIRIEHVNVKNASAVKASDTPFNNFSPCAIVSDNAEEGADLFINNTLYSQTKRFPFLSLYFADHSTKRAFYYHFNKIAQYSNQISGLIKDAPFAERVTGLRQKMLDEARLIDIESLNSVHENFGENLKAYFIKGLERSLNGHRRQDRLEYEAGQKLLTQWQIWLNSHLEDIQKGFEKTR